MLAVAEKLTKEERTFCELYVNGCAPYAGNVVKCYAAAFRKDPDDPLIGHVAKTKLAEENIQNYVSHLVAVGQEEAQDMKRFLTANLKHIIEEASQENFRDRKGVLLSPAALRSVAVSASKALMEMYPVREAQVNRVDINGGNGDAGITFNVIVPEPQKENDEN